MSVGNVSMFMQSFVALCCYLQLFVSLHFKLRYIMQIKKALGIFRELKQQEEQLEWLFGTCLPGPKIAYVQ